MPPSIKINRSSIINAAIEIVRFSGWDTINARDIAKKLNCSTQPIFREFENMEEVKKAVQLEAWEIYNRFLLNSKTASHNEALPFAIAYVKFAKEEQNLFKLIFMSNALTSNNLSELSAMKDDRAKIIDSFINITGLDCVKATKLHFNVWLVIHGIASLLATNQIEISDEEVKEIIMNNFKGYLKILREEE